MNNKLRLIIAVVRDAISNLFDKLRLAMFGWGFCLSTVGWVVGAIGGAISQTFGWYAPYPYLFFEVVLGVGTLFLAVFLLDCCLLVDGEEATVATAFVLLMLIISTGHSFAMVISAVWFGFVVSANVMIFSIILHPVYVLIGITGLAVIVGTTEQGTSVEADRLRDY